MSEIEIRFNAASLIARLEKIGQVAQLRFAVQAAALDLLEKLSEYPPASEGNQPGRYSIKTRRPMGYYIRGTGSVSPSGKVYHTSETLNRRWTHKMLGAPDIGAQIGNNASYAKYVVGDEQAYFHGRRGWKTARQVLEENRDRLLSFIEVAVEKLTRGAA